MWSSIFYNLKPYDICDLSVNFTKSAGRYGNISDSP